MTLLPLLLAAALPAAAVDITVMQGVHSYWKASPSGRLLAASDDTGISVWKLGDTRPTWRIDWSDNVEGDGLIVHAISPDDKKLLFAHADYTKAWKGQPAHRLVVADIEAEKVLGMTPQRKMHCGDRGGRLISMCERIGPASFKADGSEARYLAIHMDEPVNGEYRVSAAGKMLGVELTRLKWDEKLGWLDEKGGDSSFCHYGAGGKDVMLRSDRSSCSVVECKSQKRVAFLERCSLTEVGSLGLSRDGRLVMAGNKDELRLWDAADGRLMSASPRAPEPGFSEREYRFSPDGAAYVELFTRTVATTTEAVLRLHDAQSGRLLERYEWSSKDSPSLRYGELLPGGDALLLSRGDGELALLRFRKGAAAPALAAAAPAAPSAPAVDVDRVPASTVKTDPDAYAVLIGVEKYRQSGVPAVDYAARDAAAMRDYLVGAMGFDAKNVVLLTDGQATKGDLEKHLGPWLRNRVGASSRVFVYYAGHGAPDPRSGAAYLMPYEADPSYLDETAFPLSRLNAELEKLPSKDVTVVLDACFSGQGQRSLLAKGARPLVSVKSVSAPGKARVIAAASASQISLSHPDGRHGLLTYFLLEGLHGGADANKDGAVTAEEAFAYARPAVERAARLQNAEQTPTLSVGAGAAGRAWLTLKR